MLYLREKKNQRKSVQKISASLLVRQLRLGSHIHGLIVLEQELDVNLLNVGQGHVVHRPGVAVLVDAATSGRDRHQRVVGREELHVDGLHFR